MKTYCLDATPPKPDNGPTARGISIFHDFYLSVLRATVSLIYLTFPSIIHRTRILLTSSKCDIMISFFNIDYDLTCLPFNLVNRFPLFLYKNNIIRSHQY